MKNSEYINNSCINVINNFTTSFSLNVHLKYINLKIPKPELLNVSFSLKKILTAQINEPSFQADKNVLIDKIFSCKLVKQNNAD